MKTVSEQIIGKYHVRMLEGRDDNGLPFFRVVSNMDNLASLTMPYRNASIADLAYAHALDLVREELAAG